MVCYTRVLCSNGKPLHQGKRKKTIQCIVNQSSLTEFSGLMFHLSEISSMFKTSEDILRDHFSEEYL